MKVKLLTELAKLPSKAHPDDAGFDVYAVSMDTIYPGEHKQIKLGIAIGIEKGEVAIMSERSGMAIKYGVTSLGNVIDCGYNGEISIILANTGKIPFEINIGDRIGQIIIHQLAPHSDVFPVVEFDASERGESAHYSSGQ